MFGVFPSLPKGVDPRQVLPFILDGQASVGIAASASTDIASTVLQPGYMAIILAIGVTVRVVPEYEYTGALIFSLNIDAAPFIDNNSGNWTAQRGSVASPMPTYIRTRAGSKVVFKATRNSVAVAQPQTIAVLATGIMFPVGNGINEDGAKYRI